MKFDEVTIEISLKYYITLILNFTTLIIEIEIYFKNFFEAHIDITLANA